MAPQTEGVNVEIESLKRNLKELLETFDTPSRPPKPQASSATMTREEATEAVRRDIETMEQSPLALRARGHRGIKVTPALWRFYAELKRIKETGDVSPPSISSLKQSQLALAETINPSHPLMTRWPEEEEQRQKALPEKRQKALEKKRQQCQDPASKKAQQIQEALDEQEQQRRDVRNKEERERHAKEMDELKARRLKSSRLAKNAKRPDLYSLEIE